jgi:hypothetical protein
MSNKLDAIITKVKELKTLMQTQGKEALKDAFQEFFEAHPEAKCIVWTQYTPYFNDGDACEFRVNELALKLNKTPSEDTSAEDDDFEDNDDYESDIYDLKYGKKTLTVAEAKLVADFTSLEKATGQLDEVFELVFGDHVKVRATRNGFDVTEYDHD